MKAVVFSAAALIPIEFGCAVLAYYTLGEIESTLYLFLLATGNLIALAILFVSRRVAMAGVLLVALLVVPYQLILGMKWAWGHREAERAIQYIEDYKARTGGYPADLSGHRFRGWVTVHYSPEHGSYYLHYSVGSDTTAHSYTPEGKWFYYPD